MIIDLHKNQTFNDEKELLRKRFGQEPSDNDVEWSLLNKDYAIHTKNGNWKFLRDTRLSMAEHCKKREKYEQALSFYLGVCYLDFLGPCNVSEYTNTSSCPPFDSNRFKSFEQNIIDEIHRIIKTQSLEKEKIHSLFTEHNKPMALSLNLPFSIFNCLGLLDKILWKMPIIINASNLILKKKYAEGCRILESLDDDKLFQNECAQKYVNLATLYFKQKDIDKCNACCYKAIEYKHFTGWAYERLVINLEKQNKIEEAINVCNKLINESNIQLSKDDFKKRLIRLQK